MAYKKIDVLKEMEKLEYMKYCVKEDYTIKEALEVIDANKDRGVVVIGKEDKVIGIVSQGDILRALIGGGDLYARVATIVKPSFLYVNEKDMLKAYQVFKKTQITMLPVINEECRLIDVITLKNIYEYLEERRG